MAALSLTSIASPASLVLTDELPRKYGPVEHVKWRFRVILVVLREERRRADARYPRNMSGGAARMGRRRTAVR
jgi:hypothetical protein